MESGSDKVPAVKGVGSASQALTRQQVNPEVQDGDSHVGETEGGPRRSERKKKQTDFYGRPRPPSVTSGTSNVSTSSAVVRMRRELKLAEEKAQRDLQASAMRARREAEQRRAEREAEVQQRRAEREAEHTALEVQQRRAEREAEVQQSRAEMEAAQKLEDEARETEERLARMRLELEMSELEENMEQMTCHSTQEDSDESRDGSQHYYTPPPPHYNSSGQSSSTFSHVSQWLDNAPLQMQQHSNPFVVPNQAIPAQSLMTHSPIPFDPRPQWSENPLPHDLQQTNPFFPRNHAIPCQSQQDTLTQMPHDFYQQQDTSANSLHHVPQQIKPHIDPNHAIPYQSQQVTRNPMSQNVHQNPLPNSGRTPSPSRPGSSSSVHSSVAEVLEKVSDTLAKLEERGRNSRKPRDLPEFKGDPTEWPLFISQYRMTTKTDKVSDEDNVYRLQKCLKGRAKEAVTSMLLVPGNLKVVLETLEMNFGRPELVVEVLIQKAREVPACKWEKPEMLVDLSNNVRNLVATMVHVKCEEYLTNPELIRELERKLPNFYLSMWNSFVVGLDKRPNLQTMSDWLVLQAAGAVRSVTLKDFKTDVKSQQEKKFERREKPQRRETVLTTVEEGTVERRCAYFPTHCDNPHHSINKCKEFLKTDVSRKWELVRMFRLCFGCLKSGHRMEACEKKKQCGKEDCDQYHSPLLHVSKKNEEQPESVNHCYDATMLEKTILLRIIPVTLKGPKGQVDTYALLDEASTATLLDDEVARKIGAVGPVAPLRMNWTDSVTRQEEGSRRVTCQVIGKPGVSYKLTNVRTVRRLNLPTQSIDVDKMSKGWKYLDKVDFSTMKDAKPTILIGQDHGDLIVTREVVEGPKNGPIASLTKLGWTIHGNVSTQRGRVPQDQYTFLIHEPLPSIIHRAERDYGDEILHQLVKETWKTESFGVKVREVLPRSKDDERAHSLIIKNTRKVPEVLPMKGERWMTGLLWRDDDPSLPESYGNALKRLKGVEHKMDKSSEYSDLYCKKISEYVEKGYARKLSPSEESVRDGKTWYLPHFGVTNPHKPGKIRLVMDAAAKSNGVSLNDALLPGPDLLNPLPVVLYKFRENEIGFTGDIKEMFHQVLVSPEDVNSQRFLWRGTDRNRKPDTYVMPVTMFGAVSSPYVAAAVKNMNAELWRSDCPEAVKAITKRHYVDDYLDSATGVEPAVSLIKDVIKIMSSGGFIECNWSCSSKEVLSRIPEELRSDEKKDMNLGSDLPVERVLGLYWNPNTDMFTFTCRFPKVKDDIVNGTTRPTKRETLKLVMSLFDPLGFLAHFTIKAKILLQEVWRVGLGWDDELTDDLNDKWVSWLEELKSISLIQIPRWYSSRAPAPETIQLHVFCDASEQAFASVAYWRIKCGDSVETAFVMAKTRVSPLKPMSIPRLELQAALMGSRLSKYITEGHDMKIESIHYWSDSRTVLCWIRSDARKFKPFVAHRVGEILDESEVGEWHWVPTSKNVADEATRSKEQSDLKPDSRWLLGPEFLRSPEDQWPVEKTQQLQDVEKEVEAEMKNEFVFLITTPEKPLIDVTRFGSFSRLRRVTAWVLRLVRLTQLKKKERDLLKTTPLSVAELRSAEAWWWKKSQDDSFPQERIAIEKKMKLDSNRLCGLAPYLDSEGVIRSHSRLFEAKLVLTLQNPVILDPKHPFTKLLISHYHVKAGHHGQERVANDLRQKYWILKMRTAVKSSWNSCQECKVNRAKPHIPEMGLVPESRLAVHVRPFTMTGLDYFGPMEVTVGRRHEKRYGALFTCLTTRAVHLEVASSLTTDSAIMALRRFMARRGDPSRIYSDNGTNFRGADNELKKALSELDQEKLKNELTMRGVEWHFNPPSAPHMGGAWERLVQSVKVALKATLKERAPREEVLSTLMAEAERSINSSPLTRVSSDPNDPESLTPNHFLLGGSNESLPPGEFTDSDLCLRKQWRIAQRLADHFWKRWIKEYLPTLGKRSKWYGGTRPIKIGDLVFIADGNLERNYWPRGVITGVHPGRDGLVRVVDVKTKVGVFRRPVAKVCVLEVDPEVVKASLDTITGGGMSSPHTPAADSERPLGESEFGDPTRTAPVTIMRRENEIVSQPVGEDAVVGSRHGMKTRSRQNRLSIERERNS